MTQTDEMLMHQVQDGDLDKVGILFERYHEQLFDFFERTVGKATGVADDLVQIVFDRILRYNGTFRHTVSFRAWMYEIARNARTRHYEGQASESTLLVDDGALHSTSPLQDEGLELVEQAALLQHALLKLDPDQREVLTLRHLKEMSIEEMANVLGCGGGAVKVRAHRAFKELRTNYFKLLNEKPTCNAKKLTKKSSNM
jgi:RNA polymerase sigma factor (sigma-70 family)